MATKNVEQPLDPTISIPAQRKKQAAAQDVYVAPQWKLMYWKFRKHRLAVVSVFVLVRFYLIAVFCEIVAPYNPETTSTQFTLAPPTNIHLFDETGSFRGPFVYGSKRERDPDTLRAIYTEDRSVRYPIGFLVNGAPYKLWGRFDGR